jgi:hypothetical protein
VAQRGRPARKIDNRRYRVSAQRRRQFPRS